MIVRAKRSDLRVSLRGWLLMGAGAVSGAGGMGCTGIQNPVPTPAEVAAPSGLPQTEEEKVLYYAGISAVRYVRLLHLTEDEMSMAERGIRDALAGEALELAPSLYRLRLQQFARERAQVAAEAEKVAAEEFVAEAAAGEGAQVTDSGLVFRTITEGTGKAPTEAHLVRVHYHGTLRDGSVFDSSILRGEPATFPVSGVIPCWTEALLLMKVGGKIAITCPAGTAYGIRGSQGLIPPNAALHFEVELLEIAPPKTP